VVRPTPPIYPGVTIEERSGRMTYGARAGTDLYRRRLYESYVTARGRELAPSTVHGLQPRAAQLTKLIRSHFPPDRNAAIVDLGCGHGALIHFARVAGYRNIVGVDRSPQQVEAAQRLGLQAVRQGDLREAISSTAESSLDAVVTFDVIEHLHKDELTGFIDEVLRVLRAGGRWIIHAPNGESPLCSRLRYGDWTHETAFTRESMSQLLLSSGFARVKCYEDGPVAHGATSAIRWVLWKLIRTGLRLWLAIETGDKAGDAIFTQNLFAIAEK
jgi:2-polyprenyl-3-methyl-5-hydroxy-6-metoxy-1,4-benzoquinol methylase